MGKLHHVYIPLYPIECIVTAGTHGFQKVTLVFGKKDMGYNVTHMKLKIISIARAVEKISGKWKTQIVFVGNEIRIANDWEFHFARILKQLGKPGPPEILFFNHESGKKNLE